MLIFLQQHYRQSSFRTFTELTRAQSRCSAQIQRSQNNPLNIIPKHKTLYFRSHWIQYKQVFRKEAEHVYTPLANQVEGKLLIAAGQQITIFWEVIRMQSDRNLRHPSESSVYLHQSTLNMEQYHLCTSSKFLSDYKALHPKRWFSS